MIGAPPPEGLPTGENLSLVPDAGRNVEAQVRAMDVMDGKVEVPKAEYGTGPSYNDVLDARLAKQAVANAYDSSLQSASGYNEAMQASIARAQAAGETTPSVPKPLAAGDPIGSAIEAEVAAIASLTESTPPLAKTDGAPKPKTAEADTMNFYARSEQRWSDVEKNSSILGRIGTTMNDKMAQWGGQIEDAELKKAQEEMNNPKPSTLGRIGGAIKDGIVRAGGEIEAAEMKKAEEAYAREQKKKSEEAAEKPEVPGWRQMVMRQDALRERQAQISPAAVLEATPGVSAPEHGVTVGGGSFIERRAEEIAAERTREKRLKELKERYEALKKKNSTGEEKLKALAELQRKKTELRKAEAALLLEEITILEKYQ